MLAFLLVVTSTVCMADSQVQVHVAQGVSPGTLIFTWSTRSATQTTYVRIASGSTWQNYSGTTRDFKDSSNIWVIHSVSVALVPGSRYTYQVGCLVSGFSSSYSLQVPVDQAAVNFIVYGDLATADNGKSTWADIENVTKDLLIEGIIQTGDMAYDLCTNNSAQGDSFMDDLQPIAHYIPYMVCAGNHETTDNYYNYLQRFDMPGSKFYYTFTMGYVRFLALHTEAFLTETGMINDMMSFVYGVLNRSAADKAAYPWLIVYGHRPMYCSSKAKATACGPEASTIKGYLEALFKQYKVDLYVNGHVHNYQRTSPVYQGNVAVGGGLLGSTYVNPAATVYVTTGGPGADDTNSKIDWTNAPEWLVAGEEDYSFSVVNVFNTTHLYWQQLKSKNNVLTDSFWIIKT